MAVASLSLALWPAIVWVDPRLELEPYLVFSPAGFPIGVQGR